MNDQPPTRPQRFSMIRTFAAADVLTLGNGFCGAGSILAVMQHVATREMRYLWTGIVLLPIALFFDFADGRVARWRHRSSMLGADLDSLADVISFGMAPAALGFAIGLRGTFDVALRCDSKAASEPPPFTCNYARDRMRCDTFEQLVALWVCRSKPTMSRADRKNDGQK
ncbi:MAG TPA: CDP-alcohol phosphatidyltransferase family protein [Polyangiales bacterium]|nr:CDP-alcohol phosphatidyltransferase family protein [Polyangiales bacterium]